MAKRKSAKTDKRSKALLESTAAERKSQDTEAGNASQTPAEIKADPPRVVKDRIE